MSLFDQLVDEALQNRQDMSSLRVVVEKELLHHDILRVLSSSGMLAKLTFIGGTCLRTCYGSNRLSEDLDFTGGLDFSHESLSDMTHMLKDMLRIKYGLNVDVSDPIHDEGKVKTWKIKVQTRPEHMRNLPAQRIHIDICSIPSYHVRPMMLLNPYGVEMGTSGLIIQAESREEIFTDKLIAFAMRTNRIKYRDLWDIIWLNQQNVKPQMDLIEAKLNDHAYDKLSYLQLFSSRLRTLQVDPQMALEFKKEMYRFLPLDIVSKTLGQEDFWTFLINLMEDLYRQIEKTLTNNIHELDQKFSGYDKDKNKSKNYDIVFEMLADNEPDAKIIKYAKITSEELEQLKQSLNWLLVISLVSWIL
jgi:predicted nucleotidyltransferase component of viral defense system